MPELPEVEGARRLAEREVVGKRVDKAVVADDTKVIDGIEPKELEKALQGRTLVAAKRRGKQMWWDFDSGPSLLLHFGMTGGLVIKGRGAAHYKNFSIDDAEWPPRFCKLELAFDDGSQLAFCDSRRFAKVRFLSDPESQPPISLLGWDPVLDMPSLEAFAAALAKQRRAIKALLLDQSFSAGVGNWVADEVLFQARVHPEEPANSIPADKVAALHAAIRDVCALACAVEADSDRFPQDWLFHVRWGKGSATKAKVVVGGVAHPIDHITVGGRTSAVVPALQKLDKKAAAAGSEGKASKGAGGKAAVAAVASAAAAKSKAARGRKQPAAAAAEEEEAEVVEEQPGSGSDAEQPEQQPSKARRGKKAAAVPADAPAAAAAAAAGRGGRKFRGQPAAETAAANGSSGDAPAAGAGSGRKRKAAADEGDAAGSKASKVAVSKRQARK